MKVIVIVLAIGIILAIVIGILLKKSCDKWDAQERSDERDYRNQYFNTAEYFKEGSITRPPITNDYFYREFDFRAINYFYCRYANTSNCMNCSRRKEHKIYDQYYYGVSDNCKEYNYSDD